MKGDTVPGKRQQRKHAVRASRIFQDTLMSHMLYARHLSPQRGTFVQHTKTGSSQCTRQKHVYACSVIFKRRARKRISQPLVLANSHKSRDQYFITVCNNFFSSWSLAKFHGPPTFGQCSGRSHSFALQQRSAEGQSHMLFSITTVQENRSTCHRHESGKFSERIRRPGIRGGFALVPFEPT